MIIFELNTRLCREPLDRLADPQLYQLRALGFDWIWLMGVFRIGPGSVAESRKLSPDFEGSPYAIAEYEVSPELGGERALSAFVAKAHELGLKVMVDFVPNHMAVDSPLVDAHPEYAIHYNPAIRDARDSDYFTHPKGRLAHGKDPYFPGWTDTVQLDYAHPGLRAHQIAVLKRLAGLVDGVRCDMAMLVLREYVKSSWYPKVDQASFDRHYPEEFWSEAARAVKAERPDFVFMAEVYWDKEPYLQRLGFDFTYDKKLYDLLAHERSPHDLAAYLRACPPGYLERSVHFLENHDEERAAVRFGPRARPAAILSFALPGAPFVHMGQMAGRTEKIPVQRLVPLRNEVADPAVERFYARLLELVRDPVFRAGELSILGVVDGMLGLLRRHEGRMVLVVASPAGPPIDRHAGFTIPLDRLGLAAGTLVRAVDLWTGAPVATALSGDGTGVRFEAGAVATFADNQGFLVELTGE